MNPAIMGKGDRRRAACQIRIDNMDSILLYGTDYLVFLPFPFLLPGSAGFRDHNGDNDYIRVFYNHFYLIPSHNNSRPTEYSCFTLMLNVIDMCKAPAGHIRSASPATSIIRFCRPFY